MKNQFFKSFVIAAFTVINFSQQAKSQDRINEAGLTFSNLDNFGLNFKTGTSKAFWRFGSVYLSGNSQKDEGSGDSDATVDSKNYGIGLRAGREYRKDLFEKLEFRYGFDVSFSYSNQKYEQRYTDPINDRIENRTYYTPGLNAVLGFNYVFENSFLIGIEVLPGVSYSTGTATTKYSNSDVINESEKSSFNFNLSTSSAVLTLAYRWTKANAN